MLILEYPLQYLMYSQTRPSIKTFISNSKLFVLLSFNSFLQMVINLSHAIVVNLRVRKRKSLEAHSILKL